MTMTNRIIFIPILIFFIINFATAQENEKWPETKAEAVRIIINELTAEKKVEMIRLELCRQSFHQIDENAGPIHHIFNG